MQDPKALYLDLLKKCLTHSLWDERVRPINPAIPRPFLGSMMVRLLTWGAAAAKLTLYREYAFDPTQRQEGRDWPALAHTMIGLKRLDNLQMCVEDVINKNVPGDLIETGVWRGGAVIFMRAILKVYGITDRTVWVADSFEGLPPPNAIVYPADKGDKHHTLEFLCVSREEVQENFARYGLLDEQVQFLKGWFKDSLPNAPIKNLAILRLDGDMYESTMDALANLYPRLSKGGYVIVDDYALPGCRRAIDDFRQQIGINDPVHQVDWTGAYWQRGGP